MLQAEPLRKGPLLVVRRSVLAHVAIGLPEVAFLVKSASFRHLVVLMRHLQHLVCSLHFGSHHLVRHFLHGRWRFAEDGTRLICGRS